MDINASLANTSRLSESILTLMIIQTSGTVSRFRTTIILGSVDLEDLAAKNFPIVSGNFRSFVKASRFLTRVIRSMKRRLMSSLSSRERRSRSLILLLKYGCGCLSISGLFGFSLLASSYGLFVFFIILFVVFVLLCIGFGLFFVHFPINIF